MNVATQKIILFGATLAVMGAVAVELAHVKSNRRLGNPGIKAEAIPNSPTMKISLPETVAGFTSTNVPTAKEVLDYLPKDTSYAQRHYMAADGLETMANLILMGADRTSIHEPNYCLPGQGWQIVDKASVNISIGGTKPYELPVQKWTVHNTYTAPDGQRVPYSGLYVFWFVADNNETDQYHTIQKSILYHLVRHGVLERWAYVSYFTPCVPGTEDAVFARIQKLIAASVPEFQLPLTK